MEFGPESHKYIIEAMRSKDATTVQNALRLAFDIKAADTADEVLRIIKENEKLRRLAIAVAGAIQIKQAAPLIIQYCDEKNPMSQLGAAQSLAKIADPSSIAWLLAHVSNTELPVREACGDALAKIGEPALPQLTGLARGKDAPAARLALRVLGEIDKPQCLAVIQERAGDADWGIRLSALWAMKSMKLPAAKDALASCLINEKDPRVLSAIQSLDVEPPK
jgi:HEAT repeat protein